MKNYKYYKQTTLFELILALLSVACTSGTYSAKDSVAEKHDPITLIDASDEPKLLDELAEKILVFNNLMRDGNLTIKQRQFFPENCTIPSLPESDVSNDQGLAEPLTKLINALWNDLFILTEDCTQSFLAMSELGESTLPAPLTEECNQLLSVIRNLLESRLSTIVKNEYTQSLLTIRDLCKSKLDHITPGLIKLTGDLIQRFDTYTDTFIQKLKSDLKPREQFTAELLSSLERVTRQLLDKWIIDLKEKTKMLIIDSISKLINELPLDTPASLSREIDSFCRAKMITFGHDYERNIRQMVDALRNDLRPHIDKRVSDLKVRENDLILRKMINEFIQDLIKKTPILSENDNDEAHYSSNNVIIALLDTMMPTLPRGFISEDVSCFQDTIKQQSKVGREPDMQAKVQTLVENVSQSTQQDVTQVKSEIINYLLYKLSDNSVNLYNAFSKFKDHAKLLEHIQKSLRGERYLTKRLEKRGFNKEQRRAAILSTARQLGIAPDEYMNRVRSRKKIQVALKEKIVSILEVAYTQADPALRTKLGDKESFTTNFLDKSKFSMNFADMDLGAESFYIFLNSCWAIELQYTKQNNLRVMFKKNDESILNENDKCIGEVKIAQTKQEIEAWTNLMNSIRRNMQDVIGLVLRLSLGEIVGIIEKAGQKDNAKTMANWVESWLETKDFKAARPRGLIVDFNSRSNRFQLTDDFKEFTVGINDDKTLESITIRCSDLPLCGFGYPDSCTIIIPNSTQDGKQTNIVLTEGIKAERILAILRWLLCFTASEEA